MQADLPHVLYSHDRKGKRGGGGNKPFKYNPEDPAIKMQREAIRKKKERLEKAGEKVEYTMDELFNK